MYLSQHVTLRVIKKINNKAREKEYVSSESTALQAPSITSRVETYLCLQMKTW